MTRSSRGDDGFTLVELLVVIVILAVITVPLANAIIAYTRNSDATSQRLALSHDAQITAAFFARDVAATGVRDYTKSSPPLTPSVQTNAAYNAGGFTCGTAATPTAALRLLSDHWSTDGTTATLSTDVVAYYLETSGSVRALHRLRCSGGSTSDVIVAHYVDPGTLTVTCDTTCTGTPTPLQVTMAFTVTQPNAHPAPDPYPISVIGLRRQT